MDLDQDRARQRVGAEVMTKCDHCAGMAHAREPGRWTTLGRGGWVRVSNDNGKCNGCGGMYEPEPREVVTATVRSSGGFTADAAQVHGGGMDPFTTPVKKTNHGKKAPKPCKGHETFEGHAACTQGERGGPMLLRVAKARCPRCGLAQDQFWTATGNQRRRAR